MYLLRWGLTILQIIENFEIYNTELKSKDTGRTQKPTFP